jgi:hypothetical protein
MPHTAFVAGYDGGTFLIECDGKEVVVYGEAAHGFQFDAGWGVEPAHLYEPWGQFSGGGDGGHHRWYDRLLDQHVYRHP